LLWREIRPGQVADRLRDQLARPRLAPQQAQPRPVQEPHERHAARRVEPRHLVEERVGLVPLAQREQRLAPVGEQVDAGGAADADPARVRDARQRDVRRLRVLPQVVEQIGDVDPGSHQAGQVAGGLSRLGRALHLGEAGLCGQLPAAHPAERDRGGDLGGEVVGVARDDGGLARDLAALLPVDSDHDGRDVGEQLGLAGLVRGRPDQGVRLT
jgi:hypothetical protein